jgi:hypothetical protein
MPRAAPAFCGVFLLIRRLFGFNGKEEVGPLLLDLPKNGRWMSGDD